MRLIDSNELKEWVKNWFEKHRYYHPYSKADNIPITELYDLLEQMPTVDAEPVRHGKWREVEVDKRIVYCCTVCHTVAHMPNSATFGLYDYCPHCGAKMDGGADDVLAIHEAIGYDKGFRDGYADALEQQEVQNAVD